MMFLVSVVWFGCVRVRVSTEVPSGRRTSTVPLLTDIADLFFSWILITPDLTHVHCDVHFGQGFQTGMHFQKY